MSRKQTFERIYAENLWGDPESRSGPGSSILRTRLLRPALTQLFHEIGIRSILDLPCGDFNWMRLTDLTGISYTGADIVPNIVDRNNALYSNASRQFVSLDMTTDPLPTAELILCRDGLVHFSFSDAGQRGHRDRRMAASESSEAAVFVSALQTSCMGRPKA
jgi:hypothetical protein